MIHKDNCCLCDIGIGNHKYGKVDSPFMESDNFIAIASIGAFVEGWSLVVPKKHKLSCAIDYGDAEFLRFTMQVKQHIESIYGNAVMFEHGANEDGSLTGCGVNHAHFHIVPSEHSLEHKLLDTGLDWRPCDSFGLVKLNSSRDYLFYADNISEHDITGFYAQPEIPESQFFRKLLAVELDVFGVHDYKKHPYLNRSLQSRLKLSV